ncbi:alpha/beta hydrolase [Bifidobacterium sp. 82T24]|uniref:alpha/beta hydrolase n=1 Tax=Bifidobacterium pluvialisilvae TaxID=2834436 RepID=UPI001C583124|nr:alpha/beta hydrolase [Bifidobacterium pluvialisilvae]MBW3087203.1 alpha/beta hydrolase [Bifidobacterium pluvialisilvae]
MINEKVSLSVAGSSATLSTFFLENWDTIDPKRKRPVVLVVPGGGYHFCSEREAEPIALRMVAEGFQACVLNYSVAPARFPQSLLELVSAVAYLRFHAEEFNIDPDRIVLCGFSAGGHLCASLGTMWNEPWLVDKTGMPANRFKPNGMILGYPVITSGEFAHRGSFDNLVGADDPELVERLSLERRVTADTVPTFLWHTFEDQSVPVENSLLFASALRRAGVHFEMHIFPYGPHGLALANDETTTVGEDAYNQPLAECWPGLAAEWIRALPRQE